MDSLLNGRRGSAGLAPNPLTSRVSHSRGSGVTGTDNLRGRGRANAVVGGRGRINVTRGQGWGAARLSGPLGMPYGNIGPYFHSLPPFQGSLGVINSFPGNNNNSRFGHRGGSGSRGTAGHSRPLLGTPNGSARGSSHSQARGAAGPRPNGNSGTSSSDRGVGASNRGGRGGRTLTSIGNRRGHGDRQDQRRSQPFALDHLRNLLNYPDSSVIQSIYKDLEGWKTLLKDDFQAQDRPVRSGGSASSTRPPQSSDDDDDDKLSLVVYILGEKVCSEISSLGTAQTEILAASVTCGKFLDRITSKFMRLIEQGPPVQRVNTGSRAPWDLVRFLRCLAKFARFMSTKMKTSAVSFVTQIYPGVIGMFGAWQMMGRALSNELEDVKNDFNNLHDEKEEWQMIINHQKNQEVNCKRMCSEELREAAMEQAHQNLMAAENIRCIPIVPDAFELLSDEITFIRPLKVTGAYKDAATYLDIHFRLLREDLIRPLRDGIQEYLKSRNSNSKDKRLRSNLRLYPDVKLLETKEVDGVRVQNVQLSVKQWEKIPWGKCKQLLLNGNLLVLTPDNFRNVFFAMVHIHHRDRMKLQNEGVFGITWYMPSVFTDLRKWDNFLMVESEVYFEAYRHTLEILQTLPLDSFRMCKFIIEVSTEVSAPKYLQQPSITMDIGNRRIPPLNLSKWPTATQLKLDARQYAAYQACLTREFVIVQGPPGTGKTFLGLQVVKTLLMNQKLWHRTSGSVTSCTNALRPRVDRDLGGPILVVCYTNHALDQFLEGIVSIFSELKQFPNMVRIGGNRDSKIMSTFTLSERRKIWKIRSRDRSEVIDEKQAGNELRKLELDCTYATAELQHLKHFDGVVMLEKLQFKDELLKLDSEFPGIQKWIEFCSNLDYFGYDPSVFTSPSQNIAELIYRRFDVQAESEGYSTVNAANRSESPQRQKNVPYEDHAVAVDVESDSEDYDLDELMQRRLIDENYDEDITNVPTKLDRNIMLDVCEKPLVAARRWLADQEYNLSVFLKFDPRPEDPIDDLELAPEQRDGDTEVADYKALVEPTMEQQYWDAEMANLRALVETAQKSVSSLQAFQHYVSKIIDLKQKNELRGLQISVDEKSHVPHYSQLTEKQRWGIYFMLRQKAIEIGSSILLKKKEAATVARRHWQDLRNELDGKLLNETLVVGMTTTGAAKYYNLLKKAQSKIVIVEEAAEVLESHIVTCITPACQQLILIGDHQQLRPSTSVYELSKKFNLDLSLFERMVKNNFNCLKLEVQHRMRPEIANLVVDTIYDKLENAPKVHEYPLVKGVASNVFFLSHDHAEDGLTNSKSKSNKSEAAFLKAFCNYLIQQDYSPSQITILATYSGQMSLMKKFQREKTIPWEVRITTVDNYQGEENDIILLSLVRSNETGNIGFLKTDNRVCVALSRAKHGLFILGNMDQLSSKSPTWEAIRQKLQVRGEIGTSLRIRCEVHGTINEITTASQFGELAPEGGCLKYCHTPLKCGHICSSRCHPHEYNREHKQYKCRQPCTKSCVRNHPCEAQCYQKCPHCSVKLQKLFPDCGHDRFVPCYLFDTPLECTTLVTKELPCKHSVDMACFMDPEEYKCRTKVVKELACGHEKKVFCCKKNAEVSCRVMMKKTLLCGHDQLEQCHLAIADVKCMTEVEFRFPLCDHTEKKKCHLPDPSSCRRQCSGLLECGHVCVKICHSAKDQQHKCAMPCTKLCEKGHKCKRIHSCCAPCDDCHVQVKTQLSCGHRKLIECHQIPAMITCDNMCAKRLLCGHKCRKRCFEDCYPCGVIQKSRCGHQVLSKCGQPVTSSGDCMIPFPAKYKSPCGHEVTIPCSKRFEVSRLKLEEYCTTSGCNFRVPEIESIDIEGSHQFLLDDALVTELDRLRLSL